MSREAVSAPKDLTDPTTARNSAAVRVAQTREKYRKPKLVNM